MSKMKKMFLIVFAFSMTVMGCNTMQGVGKDVQRGGEAIEDAAK